MDRTVIVRPATPPGSIDKPGPIGSPDVRSCQEPSPFRQPDQIVIHVLPSRRENGMARHQYNVNITAETVAVQTPSLPQPALGPIPANRIPDLLARHDTHAQRRPGSVTKPHDQGPGRPGLPLTISLSEILLGCQPLMPSQSAVGFPVVRDMGCIPWIHHGSLQHQAVAPEKRMNAGSARPGKALSLNWKENPFRRWTTAFICKPAVSRRRTYTLSFARPFWRRRANTLRPSAVFIRFRNPHLRARFFLDG